MGTFFSWAGKGCRYLFLSKWFVSESAWRGWKAEKQACRYLQRRGLRLVKRRYLCRFGEIDLIMRDARVMVFIEVRYRASHSHGGALQSVNRAKRAKLERTAQHYLRATDPYHEQELRFDVVAIEGDQINWLPGVFFGEK